MSLLTEERARQIVEEQNLKSGDVYYISDRQLLTPSARAYFTEKNIMLKTGETFKEKPEHMTHLHGNVLVEKDHPRIEFRGMIDFLESEIIKVQINHPHLKNDLQEIIDFIRKILRSEVKDEEMDEFTLLGLNAVELREHSHHPSKYYGVSHFLPSCEYGAAVSDLNILRTITRRVELSAYKALKNEGRGDIIKALNRLSSLFWIMMIKEVKNGRDNK